MSRYRDLALKCVIKEEYREFFNSSIIGGNLSRFLTYNKVTGECSLKIEYNVHNMEFHSLVREFTEISLPCIADKLVYLYDYLEDE